MTPTRAKGLKLGFRQLQLLRLLARSGGRWPKNWKPRGTEKETLVRLVERGYVASLDDPVLTDEGRRIAYHV